MEPEYHDTHPPTHTHTHTHRERRACMQAQKHRICFFLLQLNYQRLQPPIKRVLLTKRDVYASYRTKLDVRCGDQTTTTTTTTFIRLIPYMSLKVNPTFQIQITCSREVVATLSYFHVKQAASCFQILNTKNRIFKQHQNKNKILMTAILQK